MFWEAETKDTRPVSRASSCYRVVQSLNSPFFPPHGLNEESRITCMRMPRTNQSKIIRSQPRRSRQCVAQCLFFSSRSERKHFLWRWYCRKKHKNVKYRCLYSYRQRVRVITLSPNIFSYCFCMLSDFAKVFERKVWRVQVAHLHNAGRALSSPSRCFQLTTSLGKISFVIFDIVIKKQIECGLLWHWWNSTDLGLIAMFLFNLNAEIVACMLSENRATSKIRKIFPNMVFPPI